MPATITLKNIPDELHLRLKKAAALNRRSLNSEVLVRLEAPTRVDARPSVDETIARLKAFHATMSGRLLDEDEVNAMKREGRP